jgi:hypothetical protein
MEGLTRLVSESLARHGFDRPMDYRRLHWSRWFRCESHHSLLLVPSKPGVFALAEEIMDFGLSGDDSGNDHVGTAAPAVRPSEARLDLADSTTIPASRRMLAVSQFYDTDDMAFVLDRMLSRQNPMSTRLASGRFFVRFVVIEDQAQRRSICNALNQWIASSAEKASGIGAHFASSLELTPATEYIPQSNDAQQSLFEKVDAHMSTRVGAGDSPAQRSEASAPGKNLGFSASTSATAPQLDSGAATNIHCPSPFPSGF